MSFFLFFKERGEGGERGGLGLLNDGAAMVSEDERVCGADTSVRGPGRK